MNPSSLLTPGRAIDFAMESDLQVRLSVGGYQHTGTVLAMDGHGVLLQEDIDVVMVRLDAVVSVRVLAGMRAVAA